MAREAREGWMAMFGTRKWHYIADGISLCGKWACLGGSVQTGNDDSPDGCVACRRALAKRKARTEARSVGSKIPVTP